MKRGKFFLSAFFLLIIFLSLTSASCGTGDIDINTATFEELQNFTGIGEVKAQAIIDYRTNTPFEKVDDLVNVKGIGSVTLENMKAEGACVENESGDVIQNQNGKDYSEEPNEEVIIEENTASKSDEEKEILSGIKTQPIVGDVIRLSPKDIKTDANNENSGNKGAYYGFAIFCIVLAFLFFISRKRFKNEFD